MTKTTITSAGFMLIKTGPSPEVLLLRAYRNWDFPKGVVEAGETPMTTAVRELNEETGLSPSSLRYPWGEAFYETPPYPTAHRGQRCLKQVRLYLAVCGPEIADVRLSPEHHEARWASLHDARRLVVQRLRNAITWAEQRLSP